MSRTPGYVGAERRASTARRVPALFVAHGVPNTVLDDEFGNALRRFGGRQGPLDGAVVVSAHWESLRPIRVTRSAHPELLYDFSELSARVDQMSFSCAGSTAVSDRVLRLLAGAGLQAAADPARGFDHGTWVPLSLLFRSGRVPIVQVSIPTPAGPEDAVALGRVLAPLRDQNILLVGSGGIVHNLHRLRFTGERQGPEPWALGFDGWVRDRARALDLAALCDYRRRAPHALECVPTPEHFNPLLFVLGTAGPGDRVVDVYEGFRYGSLSMRSLAVVGRRRRDECGVPPGPAPRP